MGKDAPPDLLHASNGGFRRVSAVCLISHSASLPFFVVGKIRKRCKHCCHETDVCPKDNQARVYNNTVNTHNLLQVCCCCFIFGDWLKGGKGKVGTNPANWKMGCSEEGPKMPFKPIPIPSVVQAAIYGNTLAVPLKSCRNVSSIDVPAVELI